MEVDVDKLLRRRLQLQRYVTSLLNDVSGLNKDGDKQLILELSEFIANADDRTLAALGAQRSTNTEAKALLLSIKSIAKEQRDNVIGLVRSEMGELAASEAAMTASALGEKAPSVRGVATLPVAGVKNEDRINAAYSAYAIRLISEITQAAMTDPQGIPRMVRGGRADNFRDGLFFWRDQRLAKDFDLITNGVAANSAEHVYRAYQVEKVDHLSTLDYRVCLSCRSASENGPYEIGTQPRIPLHPRCLVGSTLVSAGSRVSAVSERHFDGDVVVIRTASGNELTCTPNHPILTSGGFVPASFIDVGSDVISDGIGDGELLIDDDHKYVPAKIEEFANTFRSALNVSSVEVPVTTPDFHCDGEGSDVAVISINSKLRNSINAPFGKEFGKRELIGGRSSANQLPTFGLSSRVSIAYRNALRRGMSGLNLASSFFRRHLGPFEFFGFALCAPRNSVFFENERDNVSGNAERFGDSIFRSTISVSGDDLIVRELDVGRFKRAPDLELHSGGVKPSPNSISAYAELAGEILDGLNTGTVFVDDVIDIQVRKFSGHVYNLETEDEYYIGNGIVNHNCRCINVPHLDITPERPFVEDDRSVKDIPISERDGIIGRTRDTTEQFFDRMTRAERREYMGPTRAQLWEQGKITDVRQLVNEVTLEPLRLDQLPAPD